jgi:hypothetical protein
MARSEVTNGELNRIQQDIASFTPALRFFFKEKINRFYSMNKLTLRSLNNFLASNVQRYVLHDEEGKPLTEDKNGERHFVFANEEDEKKYVGEATGFMNRSAYIES